MKTGIQNFGVIASLCLLVGCGSPPSKPRARAEGIHGLKLPASAQDIQSVGDAWRGFLDRGASTVFTMNATNLQDFVATLDVDTNLWTCIPGNDEYHRGLRKPWKPEAKQMTNLSCRSPVGDFLHVRIFELNTNQLGVHIYTDWN